MSVIPFNLERPFPEMPAESDKALERARSQIRILERTLLSMSRDWSEAVARAEKAERRVEEMTAELFRIQLAEDTSPSLNRTG